MLSCISWKTKLVVTYIEGGVNMADSQNEVSKAEVQSTKLNKLPVPDQADTEFSAEEAAEVFEKNQNQSTRNRNQN